jgi:hypothetical protein
MNNFSDPYRQAVFFGVWADETADRYGQRDALQILADAAERCMESDMRTRDVLEALKYLERSATRRAHFVKFRQALGLPNADRAAHVREAYSGIVRVLNR